jgi:stromal membrane-associated protein
MSSRDALSKFEKEKLKLIQEKCQAILNDMLRDEDNKYCVDCDAKGEEERQIFSGQFLILIS